MKQLPAEGAKRKSHQNSVQVLRAEFQDAALGFTPDARLKMLMSAMNLEYFRDQETYAFPMRDIEALLNFRREQLSSANFKARLYDGSASGFVSLDRADPALKLYSQLQVEHVSAHQLDTLLLSLFGPYRNLSAKLQGRVEGTFGCKLNYRTYPRPELNGELSITDGHLENVQFFVWLSDFFRLPELKNCEPRFVHRPWQSSDFASLSYPKPIVDHDNARARALAAFKTISGANA